MSEELFPASRCT